jgi:hypothetical protein
MSGHKTTIAGADDAWQGRCSCRMRSPVYDHRWEADDWNRNHLAIVDRVRTHLARSPSLRDQYAWFSRQAEQAADPEDRRLWGMLAEELGHRLGSPPHDEPLFD